jgi:pyridoxine 5-phosphate synthase
VSYFIEPDVEAVRRSAEMGARAVEFHTGGFCHRMAEARSTLEQRELLLPLCRASEEAHRLGLQSHVGHGLNYSNAHWIQAVPFVEEANIGHAIVARALFVGLPRAVEEMRRLLNDAGLNPHRHD